MVSTDFDFVRPQYEDMYHSLVAELLLAITRKSQGLLLLCNQNKSSSSMDRSSNYLTNFHYDEKIIMYIVGMCSTYIAHAHITARIRKYEPNVMGVKTFEPGERLNGIDTFRHHLTHTE